jgi:hypothetical protein
MSQSADDSDVPMTFDTVYAEELKCLGHDPKDAGGEPLAALCLSGGGIRSASFCLGALQALASKGLLEQFHYLSTVSGGGYIGSWLSAWRAAAGGDELVFKALNAGTLTGVEAPEIRGIRYNSNYLTPKLGLLSADTWTVIALYIRNLVLNWALFIPLFLAIFLIPHLCVGIVEVLQAHRGAVAPWMLWGGGTLLIAALSIAMYGRARRQTQWLTQGRFLVLVLLPVVLSAACLASAGALGAGPTTHVTEWGAVCGAAIYVAAWVLGSKPLRQGEVRSLIRRAGGGSLARDFLGWALAGAAVGSLISLGFGVAVSRADPTGPYVVLGLSWVVAAYLVGELIYVGITSFSKRGEMDREWLARSSGWLTAVALSWALFTAVCLYVPDLVLRAVAWLVPAIAAVGGLSGVITLALGASAKSAANSAEHVFSKVKVSQWVSLAACVFALSLSVAFAFGAQYLAHTIVPTATPTLAQVAWLALGAAVLLALSVLLSLFINVNRFSVHALYRNRLVRAFLGAARARAKTPRSPDPFTGFDLADNVAMTLVKPDAPKARLLHVINMALNTVGTDNLAWQERKASSFTVTPLACGNKEVGYRQTSDYGHPEYGLSLGTAMAISGAAASPNMGYNSSPLVSFLLMLFNVRLGWWLGNPARCKRIYERQGPIVGIKPALTELVGATTDKGNWIYLSDGGHFENLGLYEMVRRRCQCIVVCDAGCDETASFEDLGNALRKVEIDFGVTITFSPPVAIQRRRSPPRRGPRCALGTIRYPAKPGGARDAEENKGWIVYLKPALDGTEPMGVRSYAEAHKTFPHESTADQWFSESQLESYRALGEHTVQQVLDAVASGRPLAAVPDAVRSYLSLCDG